MPVHYIRISGLTVIAPRLKPGSGELFVDVLFPDADILKAPNIPRHKPLLRLVAGTRQIELPDSIVEVSAGTGDVVLEGAGTHPTDPEDKVEQLSFDWLARMNELTGDTHSVRSDLLPEAGVSLPLALRSALRIKGGDCRLQCGGFAASKSKAEIIQFRVGPPPGAGRLGFLAEAALLVVTTAAPLTMTKSDRDWLNPVSISGFSTDIDKSDLFINETGVASGFSTDFEIFAQMVDPVPPTIHLVEHQLLPWPPRIPRRLRGGRTAGRPVCPPVVVGP